MVVIDLLGNIIEEDSLKLFLDLFIYVVLYKVFEDVIVVIYIYFIYFVMWV